MLPSESEEAINTTASIQDFTNGASFNGALIVPVPLTPGVRSVELSITDTVATITSPFSLQSTQQAWLGGDLWEGTVTLPKMTRIQASQWIAFLMALRGSANCFLIGDPWSCAPQGLPRGVPVVDSSILTNNLPMTSTLVTRGWLANTVRHLEPGDYIQIGNRLHSLLKRVDSSGTGTATLQIYPSLREQPADGTPVITHNAKGLFRLATNKRTWSVDQTRLYGLSFRITEAK